MSLQPIKNVFENSFPKVMRSLEVVDLKHFLDMELPQRELILSPWLPQGGLCMVHAFRGVGKTHVSLGIAYAVAMGGEFLGWQASCSRNVLFIDGEMSASALQERLSKIVTMAKCEVAPGKLSILTRDLQTNEFPDLATSEGQAVINRYVTNADLIILDNLSCLAPHVKENEAADWSVLQSWLLNLRAKGKSVLLIHHSGKNGAQRGTSRREDILDSVIVLERPKDYSSNHGARFVVKYEKARGFYGELAQPFEAHLCSDEGRNFYWKTQPVDESAYQKVVTLLNEGMSQKDIANELELHKSNVSRYAKRAKEEGLLEEK